MSALDPVYDLAIVGGGQAAKALLMLLAERSLGHGATRTRMRVAIFERGQEIGSGSAWGAAQNLAEHVASQPGAAPRIQYGREQVRVVQRLVALLVSVNVHVELFHELEIIDLHRVGRRWIVQSDRSAWVADAVILATGHWRSIPAELAEIPHEYPWPASQLQGTVLKLRPGAAIGILGAYHTAIDTALTIALAFGKFEEHGDGLRYVAQRAFTTTLLSRTGRLPLVWPEAVPTYDSRHFQASLAALGTSGRRGDLGLDQLLCAVRGSLARRTCADAARAMSGLSRVIEILYLPDSHSTLERCLSLRQWKPRALIRVATVATLLPLISEQFPRVDARSYSRFQREFRTSLFNIAMPMARITAARMRALMRAGVLRVEAIGRYRWRVIGGKPTLFCDTSSGETTGRRFDLVVSGLGANGPIAEHPDRLMRSLLRQGFVTAAFREYAEDDRTFGTRRVPVPGLQIDPRTCEVVPAARIAAGLDSGHRLYSIGTNNSGHFLDAQSVGHLARDAARIVSHLAASRINREIAC